MIDNGIKSVGSNDITSIIGDFNHHYNDYYSDWGFKEAAMFASMILANKVTKYFGIYKSKTAFDEAAKNLHNGSILVLDKGMPYQRWIFENKRTDILMCVLPGGDKDWRVNTIPVELGSFEHRVDLPKEWGGLEIDALVQESGISDAVFVHKKLFVGGAKTKESALKMAEISLQKHFEKESRSA
jgi:uncharacterized UPF0160 family protein